MCSTCAAESAAGEVPFAWGNSSLVWSVPSKVKKKNSSSTRGHPQAREGRKNGKERRERERRTKENAKNK